MWLWIMIGVALLLFILLVIVLLYCRHKRNRQQNELNAMVYSQVPGQYETVHDGDLIQRDLTKVVDEKGAKARTSQFLDHADILRATGVSDDA